MVFAVRQAAFAPARIARVGVRPAQRSRVVAQASDKSGFDIDKFVADLPVEPKFAYAGVAWGLTILTWSTPLNFIGKSVILLHVLAALTSVARLGAIARPDQETGETEAAKAFGMGLLIGPFNVGWLGVERFDKKP
eukprot:TRINITY_DN4008_c0_g3_i2.p1 TRINITY_DN4008_c0_g3~~TRINITY_DN4008_c0_g3_i2.p1  ORF type:complete len:136 (+),score=14.85 TRINITY_DN4008_c0_g3_i2:95-502(+)